MHEISYRVTLAERHELDDRLRADFYARWMPVRTYQLLRTALAIAVAVICFGLISPSPLAFAVMAGVALCFWGYEALNRRITESSCRRFLDGLPGFTEYKVSLEGQYLMVENRGYKAGLPLAVAKMKSENGFTELFFPILMIVRIPWSAFPDEWARLDFEHMVSEQSRVGG